MGQDLLWGHLAGEQHQGGAAWGQALAQFVHKVLGNAKWTGLGLIGLYGFAGARLSGAGVLVSVMQAVGVALIGALLIALKALVH